MSPNKHICEFCIFLRTDIKLVSKAPVSKFYGKTVYPCNRYPQNILRHKSEPGCGEFYLKPL